jgi:hypothetical protein
MSRIPVDVLNRRLCSATFLSGSDLESFQALKLEIEGLKEPDEQLAVPQPTEPMAWARTYTIYAALKKRRDKQAAANAQAASQDASDHLLWNETVGLHAQLRDWIKREHLDADMREYLGLKEGDEGDLVVDSGNPAFGFVRRPDWRSVADRIRTASWKLRQMSNVDKSRVPDIMASRRMASAINSLSEKLNTFEQKLDWFEQRISSVESKFISNKH